MRTESKIAKYLSEQKSISSKSIILGDSFQLGGTLGDAAEKISALNSCEWYYDPSDSLIVCLFSKNKSTQLNKKDLSKIFSLPKFGGISYVDGELAIDIDFGRKVPKGLLDDSWYDDKGNFNP